MTITVSFEIKPPSTGRSTKKSPSNFAIDRAQETKNYSVVYDYDPKLNSQENDEQISSVYVREFVKDFLSATVGETQLKVPIESRFYHIFPLYVGWVAGQTPALATKGEMVNSLQLAF